MTENDFKMLPREQRQGVHRLWMRLRTSPTFAQWVARVEHAPADTCVMIEDRGIWYGIETDGYTHT